jgi:hypothetical protein
MSVESWTHHALAVKSALQLGLHSPLSYRELSMSDAVSNLRLWYSLINQDRYVALLLHSLAMFSTYSVKNALCVHW